MVASYKLAEFHISRKILGISGEIVVKLMRIGPLKNLGLYKPQNHLISHNYIILTCWYLYYMARSYL